MLREVFGFNRFFTPKLFFGKLGSKNCSKSCFGFFIRQKLSCILWKSTNFQKIHHTEMFHPALIFIVSTLRPLFSVSCFLKVWCQRWKTTAFCQSSGSRWNFGVFGFGIVGKFGFGPKSEKLFREISELMTNEYPKPFSILIMNCSEKRWRWIKRNINGFYYRANFRVLFRCSFTPHTFLLDRGP